MSRFNVIDLINQNINANNVRAITGIVLNNVLIELVDNVRDVNEIQAMIDASLSSSSQNLNNVLSINNVTGSIDIVVNSSIKFTAPLSTTVLGFIDISNSNLSINATNNILLNLAGNNKVTINTNDILTNNIIKNINETVSISIIDSYTPTAGQLTTGTGVRIITENSYLLLHNFLQFKGTGNTSSLFIERILNGDSQPIRESFGDKSTKLYGKLSTILDTVSGSDTIIARNTTTGNLTDTGITYANLSTLYNVQFANTDLQLTSNRNHDFNLNQMTFNNVKQFKAIATVAPPSTEASFVFRGFGTTVLDKHFVIRNSLDTNDAFAVSGLGNFKFDVQGGSGSFKVVSGLTELINITPNVVFVGVTSENARINAGTPTSSLIPYAFVGEANTGLSRGYLYKSGVLSMKYDQGSVSVNSINNLGATLGVLSSGILLSDIVLKIRNFTDTLDFLNIAGNGQITYNGLTQFKAIATVAPPSLEASFRYQGFGNTVNDRIFTVLNGSGLGRFQILGDGMVGVNGANYTNGAFAVDKITGQTRVARLGDLEFVTDGTPTWTGQGFSIAGANRTIEILNSGDIALDNIGIQYGKIVGNQPLYQRTSGNISIHKFRGGANSSVANTSVYSTIEIETDLSGTATNDVIGLNLTKIVQGSSNHNYIALQALQGTIIFGTHSIFTINQTRFTHTLAPPSTEASFRFQGFGSTSNDRLRQTINGLAVEVERVDGTGRHFSNGSNTFGLVSPIGMYFHEDNNPNITPTANGQVLSLYRFRHRGVDGAFTGVLRPLILSENSAGGQFQIQLFETGLRLGYASIAAPTALFDIKGSGANVSQRIRNGSDTFDTLSILGNGQVTYDGLTQLKATATIAPPTNEASFRFRGFGATATDRHFALRNSTDTLDFLAIMGNGRYEFGGIPVTAGNYNFKQNIAGAFVNFEGITGNASVGSDGSLVSANSFIQANLGSGIRLSANVLKIYYTSPGNGIMYEGLISTFGGHTFKNSANITDVINNFINIRSQMVFAPTAVGTNTFNGIEVNDTINQTGGHTGITRGLYINPIVTAATDFRAIDVVTGKIKFPLTTYADNATATTALGGIGFLYKLADGTVMVTV